MKSRLNTEWVRAQSRSPLTDAEVPHAEALGAAVLAFRKRLGIARQAAADAALLSPWGLWAIERGVRRTRASTLARIAEGLVRSADPDDAESLDAATLAAGWVALAGPALAAESPFRERIERRARRRQRRKVQGLVTDAKVEQRARLLAERMIAEERL